MFWQYPSSCDCRADAVLSIGCQTFVHECIWHVYAIYSMYIYIYVFIYIYIFMNVSVCMSTYVYLFISSHLSYVIHMNPRKQMAQFRPRRHGLRIRGGQDLDGHQRCLCTTGSTAGEATDQVRCAAAIAFVAPWQRWVQKDDGMTWW